MLNEIDSSELVVYLAKKRFAGKESAIISMSEIILLANYLARRDATIRVNLSQRSFENLSNYTNHLLSYNSKEVRIDKMNNPRMIYIMNQYQPTAQIVRMLNKAHI